MSAHELERTVKDAIRKACNGVTRLFNNPVGVHITLDGKRVGKHGLIKGSSDLIGWTTVTITPDMIGQRVAVFTAIEVKKPKGGKIREHQENFIAQVIRAGGLAGRARSVAEALAIVRGK